MSFYPPQINERFAAARRAGSIETAAAGTSATFVCGAAARFFLRIDAETKEIREARFQTNGCGFAVAAADVLAERMAGVRLPELHGLERDRLLSAVEDELGGFDGGRRHCIELCVDALQAALAAYRAAQIEEWAGETALVCSCFGVSEETIERAIADYHLRTVEEVTDKCAAGGGCGACRPLIREILDGF